MIAKVSKWIQFKIVEPTMKKRLGRLMSNQTSVIKYMSYKGDEDYVIANIDKNRSDDPIPPKDYWLGYGNTPEEYIGSGKEDVKIMLDLLAENGYIERNNQTVLDLGCGGARMLRNMKANMPDSELWGLDIDAKLIYWNKLNLGDRANFATTTLIPHLPFGDGHFDLVYTGSVFTHIDDLAEAWLLEIARVLKKGAIFYLTIHDESTVQSLATTYKEHPLAVFLHENPTYNANKDNFGMLVIGRDNISQVFYSTEYFKDLVSPRFEILGKKDNAYGYQTAVVLRRK